MSTARKILVLGQIVQLEGVESYFWSGLPQNLNVADYDTVILDFSPLIPESDFVTNFPLDQLPPTEDFARLMFSAGSTIVAIGDPSLELQAPNESGQFAGVGSRFLPVTWFLPADLPIRRARHHDDRGR